MVHVSWLGPIPTVSNSSVMSFVRRDCKVSELPTLMFSTASPSADVMALAR